MLRPEQPDESPLYVKGVKLGLSRGEVVAAVREEGRERERSIQVTGDPCGVADAQVGATVHTRCSRILAC